jgi:hypothetical protein
MKKVLLGHVAVDSGQLLLCDPCYIDSEWVKEDFTDIRVYKHKTTGKTLQYLVDFPNYAEEIPEYGIDMNALLQTGDWEQVEDAHKVKNGFSYNACCKATLSEQSHGELSFKLGHTGVGLAFSTPYGDGFYPVFAMYDKKGNLHSVIVELT